MPDQAFRIGSVQREQRPADAGGQIQLLTHHLERRTQCLQDAAADDVELFAAVEAGNDQRELIAAEAR